MAGTTSNTLSGFSAFGGGANISGNDFEADATLGGGGAHKNLLTVDKHYLISIQTSGTTNDIEVRQQASDGLDYVVFDGLGTMSDSLTVVTDYFIAEKTYVAFNLGANEAGTVSYILLREIDPSTHGAMENNTSGDLAED